MTTFTAEALAQNTPMLHLFADAGLPVQRHYDDGVAEVTIQLPADDTGTTLDTFLETVARRERTADAASLRHVLAPESVVVIGASRRTGTAGRAILDNIRACGTRAACMRSFRTHRSSAGWTACRRWPTCPKRRTWP